MRQSGRFLLVIGCVFVFGGWAVRGLAQTPPGGSQDLEIEKLRLEKEKLQLEVEKLKLEATVGVRPAVSETPATGTSNKKTKDADLDAIRSDYSLKAKDIALLHKDEADLLVLDALNAEVWYRGTPYGIYEWDALVEDQGWKPTKSLEGRDPGGRARNKVGYRNVSLLRYEGRKAGILTFDAPKGESDFKLLTPEGWSFQSAQEDVRGAFRNEFMKFDRQKRDKKGLVLRYNHKNKWGFDEKMEVAFDRDGHMTQLRYGVLDER